MCCQEMDCASAPPLLRRLSSTLDDRMTTKPKLLSYAEYRSTFAEPMREITGKEHEEYPDGVMDVDPYLRNLSSENLDGLELLPDEPPAAVYATRDGRVNHVLYKCNRSNVYAVIVIRTDSAQIYGHYMLDLSRTESTGPVV